LTELFKFQPSTAPGREAPSPAPAQPAQGPPPPSGDAAPPGFSPTTLLFLALPILIIFMMTRSQSKKQKDLEASLKVGDRVVTRGGMLGRVVELNGRAKLEIAPGVNVMVLRSAIEGVDSADAKPASATDKAKADEKKDAAPQGKDKAAEKKA
jgi:preprotein translocase subunit YajC